MSHHYSASQFDHAFKPTRLNVYNPFTNKECPPHGVHAMCLPTRCGGTSFIADDSGRLLDCIPRGPSSPWGDYADWIWQKKYDCCCAPQLRHPEDNCCEPKTSIFVSRSPPPKKCCPPPEKPCFESHVRLTCGECLHDYVPRLQELLCHINCNVYKRCEYKNAQIQKKACIDNELCNWRDCVLERNLIPAPNVDWHCIRKFPWGRKLNRPPCAPVNACCACPCNIGAPRCCPCLNEENYIRRFTNFRTIVKK